MLNIWYNSSCKTARVVASPNDGQDNTNDYVNDNDGNFFKLLVHENI